MILPAWRILEPDRTQVDALVRSLPCHPVTAALLVNREITAPAEARRFLTPCFDHLPAPDSLAGMPAALDRIARALRANEKILVVGDYDVDGVCATVLLLDFLRACGAPADYHIPHRIQEGYGLRPQTVRDRIVPAGIDLVITVDCGSHSHKAIAAARRAGIDVIVTDHHIPPDELPDASAVINPKRPNGADPPEDLAGVGVVFMLLLCLRRRLRADGFWRGRREPNLKQALDLVALGTVADMVPLTSTNRFLAHQGLVQLAGTQSPGLRALMEVSNLDPAHGIDETHIAFRLAPRLNAPGRIADATPSVALLQARAPAEARRLAHRLDALNAERRDIEARIVQEIEERLEASREWHRHRVLVLASPHWHEGVLGIAASRLARKYHRPTVLLNLRNGVAHGSARGVPGVNLYKVLHAGSHCMMAFGGHAMAAGVTLAEDRVAEFHAALEDAAATAFAADDDATALTIDDTLDFDTVTPALVTDLERLRPFGSGNPEPVFATADVRVVSARTVGACHRRLLLEQSPRIGGPRLEAMHFNIDPQRPVPVAFERIAYHVQRHRWNGREKLQLIIADTQVGG